MIRRVWRFVVIAWALRTSWLTVAYVLGWGGVARRHVETAGFILAGLLLVAVAGQWGRSKNGVGSDFRDAGSPAPRKSLPTPFFDRSHFRDLAALAALAAAVYWPALSIGLLSDDFVLLERASAWTLIDPAWEMVRPLPLALWGGIARVLPALWLPPALHLLNVGLHAVNAWLMTLLMRRFGYSATVARIAAVGFLLFPASVEAVAWISGVFDVLLTTLALAMAGLAVSTARPVASTWAAIGMTGLALATKETAIVLPALILIAAWLGSRHGGKQLWMTATGSAVLVLAYVGWRVAGGTSASAFPPLDGYAAKELLTRPFGALILPFHQSFIAGVSVAAALYAAATPLLVACRVMLAEHVTGFSRLAVGAVVWVLAAAAPVFTWFFVGPDLQGSRYVYLASAAWSMLIAVAVVPARPAGAARAVWLGVIVWLAFSAIAVRSHLEHWTSAGRARDAALAAALRADPSCGPTPGLVPPQDDVSGAYVFRNGFAEAWRRECRRLEADPRRTP